MIGAAPTRLGAGDNICFSFWPMASAQQGRSMLKHRFNAVDRLPRQARLLLLCTSCALAACSSPPAPWSGAMPADQGEAMLSSDQGALDAAGYVLEPGDIVRISLWREPGLDDTVLVRPDGGISFPLAGELLAEGKTIAEVRAEVTQRLAEFIPDPVVTVSLQQNDGNRIFVTGRVNKPGTFVLTRPVDIMQAISIAGGLSPFADKQSIRLIRRQSGQQIAIPFNYKRVQNGEDLQQNILLQAGDTIVVP